MLKLSKELFIETIDFIRERNDQENKIYQMFKEEFTDGIFWPYSRYETQLIKVLTEVMQDQENEWISYYCWEKDFGRDYRLKAFDKDGKEIPLTSSEDLYNLLISNE